MRDAEILIVDDSATQLEALRSLLAEAGYRVRTARDGIEALAHLGEDGIDLVLSDVIMPGMSGYELCTAIKERRGEASPPVVLLTSLADPTDIVRGLECGADNYITKPYEAEHLLARIAQVLDNRELRRGRERGAAIPIRFLDETFTIRSDREQVLDLLLSSFEELIRTNDALQESKRALNEAHARANSSMRRALRSACERASCSRCSSRARAPRSPPRSRSAKH
jgi:DNA-binding response OmpR family regulator